ncbi:MAG: hypothetical protein M3R59_03060 [Verrucomicrobiota bacterium]|nr:hypothetical protein [Verrucomicrobiota bacterium]
MFSIDRSALLKTGDQRIDKFFLFSDAREQSEVSVFGEAGFAPSLHGESTNEAEAPLVLLAELL